MKKALYLLILFVISSCSSPDSSKEKGEELKVETVIKYSDAIQGDKDYSELFDKVEMIPLDTTGNFLIGDVGQMKLACNRIFVLDKRNAIYIFDKQGRGQAVIDKRGQGANEYINIRGFDVTPDSLLCLLTFPSKLMYFTLDGTFVKETKLDFQGVEMALLPDNKAAVYVNNVCETTEESAPLLEICDQTNGQHHGYVSGYKCLANFSLPTYQQGKALTPNIGGELLFVQPLSNNIYAIKNDRVSIKYQIDFGKQNPPKSLSETPRDVYSVHEFIQEHFPVYGFNSCWENDSYFHIQFFLAGGQLKMLLYDKEKKVCYAGFLKENMTGCHPRLIEATNQYLIGYWSAEDIMSLVDCLNFRGESTDTFPGFEELAKYANEKENPIVCLYHFKKEADLGE